MEENGLCKPIYANENKYFSLYYFMYYIIYRRTEQINGPRYQQQENRIYNYFKKHKYV